MGEKRTSDASSVPRRHKAEAEKSVPCAVITVSDTRGESEDKSGKFIRDALTDRGILLEDKADGTIWRRAG